MKKNAAKRALPLDQPHRGRARQQIAQRLLGRDEGGGGAALDQRARVERVAGAERRHDLVAVALLDMALHDDEQVLRRRALGEDRLAGAEIADVERGAHRLDLGAGEPVERGVLRVEAESHKTGASRGGGARAIGGWAKPQPVSRSAFGRQR